MNVEPAIAGVRAWRRGVADVGLVPTMGALHEGHLALVQRARAECSHVAASIFVNPTQFGPSEDLDRYPRPLERDLELLREEGVDLVFLPSVEEIYPPGSDTAVVPGALSRRLEGRTRPGHFRGVATVVTKLLNVVCPDRAYFGEKDGQQLRVVQALVRDLFLPVTIVPVPTVREADGLALSSRNVYLSPEGRRAATVLWRALQSAEASWESGERRCRQLRDRMRAVIDAEPLATADYVSVADPSTLRELPWARGDAFASLAVRIEGVHLIDNVLLTMNPGARSMA
ncbi:MAG TPA: pantoate--beta-alanine ligase [Dehalococcoidia bacterium]|nr:pantoate--beta-alanine ligase [Dehalococcoidia bacterium]